MSKPYKEVNPGDPILATDWNAIQTQIRDHILTHAHTGANESGAKLDITALAFGADIAVRKLSATESLTVGSANQPLLTVNPAAPNQEGNYQVSVAGTLRADQVRTSRLDGIASLAVGSLAVTGNIGIGVTAAPQASLEVNGDGKFSGPVITPQVVGDPTSAALEIVGAGPVVTERKITLVAEGGATVQGGLTVQGARATLNNGLNVSGPTTLNDNLTFGGELALANGITWYNADPTAYGIYRTAGAWIGPDFQQLRVKWLTGIILDPGTAYGKSYVDIQGNGLRVTTGNVGIGATNPSAKLDIMQATRTGAHPTAVKGLYVTGDFGAASDGVEFRHTNATQGVGIGFNTIYAAGTNTNQDLNLQAKGTGTVGIATSSTLSFGNQTRQMINLWATGYGIGVQNSTQYFRTDKNFAWYKGGAHNDAELNAGTNGTVQMVIKDGNVGIGATEPAGRLHIDKGRVDITTSDGANGGQNRFNGLTAWNEQTSYRRGQFVLSSNYSDLVIASSNANDNHGSTLTFATYNPADATDYRKWVVNQGNWGQRKQFLDFGYSDANGRANPHLNINSTDTVLTLDGVNKRVGIGTTTPGAKLSFNNTDSSSIADGITWYNPTPNSYGIHRTAGAWSAPNYQQLRLGWQTGIVLDPGTAYGKSYVDIQGNGLCVTSGNVAIGTASAGNYKLNVQGGNAFFSDHLDIGNFQPADRFLTLKVQGGNKYRSGVRFWAWQENFGYSIEHDERDAGFYIKGHNVDPNGSPLMVIKGGNVGIGTTTPERKLHIKQPKSGNGIRLEETDANGAATGRHLNIHYEGQGTVVFYHQSGAGQYLTQNGSWNLNSDRALKENIRPLQGILDKVLRLKPVRFQWQKNKLDDLGFVAQDVEPIFPELVSQVNLADSAIKGLPYATFGVLAIAALQELVATLEPQINALATQVQALTNAK